MRNSSFSAIVVSAVLGVSLCPSQLSAQQRGTWETGVDLGGEVTFEQITEWYPWSPELAVEKRTRLTTDIPLTLTRIGVFVTDALEVESSLGFSLLFKDLYTDKLRLWSGRLELVGNYSLMRSSSVSPYFGTGVVAKLQRSYSRFGFQVDLGLRIPAGSRRALRIESGFVYWLADDTANYDLEPGWTVPFRLGMSFYGGTQQEGEHR